MEKVLEVRNLKISFRTSGGTLRAVRGISFDLEKGRTVAIVGESGSGKSVTSKAILGILAGNVEGGEILYDGRDLLKVSEEEMCTIRGGRISMIFQDPLSSLNPIVKIGKQITEAMLLKNVGSRKAARNEFNTTLAHLRDCIIAAVGDSGREKVTGMIRTFDLFNTEAIRLEHRYLVSVEAAKDLASDIGDFLFLAGKRQKIDGKRSLREFAADMERISDPFLIHGFAEELSSLASEIREAGRGYRPVKDENGTWKKVDTFEYDDQLPYGHGEKSVYIITGYMRLTREEAFAIRYHMGYSSEFEDIRNVSKAFEMFPLAFAVHLADSEATYFIEGTPKK